MDKISKISLNQEMDSLKHESLVRSSKICIHPLSVQFKNMSETGSDSARTNQELYPLANRVVLDRSHIKLLS